MAEFVFVPSDIEHPTAEERYFLLRHIGHDLTNDSFVIEGLSSLISKDNAKCSKYIGTIHALAHNNLIVQRGLVILNKKYPITKESKVNLETLLFDLLSFSGIEFKLSLEPRTYWLSQPKTLKNCREVIHLQLINFIQNVHNYGKNPQKKADTPDGVFSLDMLTLSEKELKYLGRNKIQYTPQDSFIKASVQDFGQGIAPERLPYIIPRTEELTINPRRRTGLSLTDYVCDYLHGFVKVESELGKGSTFSLYFPQEYKPRKSPKQPELFR